MYQGLGKNARVGAAGVLVGCALLSCVAIAHAEQPRDFMFSAPESGDYLTLDYFGTGGQVTVERHQNIYGAANDVTVGANTLLGYPLGQVAAYTNLRIVFLELGVLGAYRVVWRNLSFAPGAGGEYCDGCDRSSRRGIDPVLGHGPDTDRYAFGEAKAQLYAPFNDGVVFTSYVAARYEDSRDRSYDWFFASVHDGGVVGRWESNLFFKHRAFGGIAPYVQVMFLPRAGRHETEVAYGLNATTRLGLIDRDDLLFLTFLIRPGDRYYGQHAYYSPVRALIVYRMILAL